MIELKPRAEASVFWTYASPVLALLLTVCIGLCIFVALGKDPIQGLLVFFAKSDLVGIICGGLLH